jgi:hypothetical protein
MGALPWFERAVAALILGENPVPVARVQNGLPEVWDEDLLGGVPGPGLDLGADAPPLALTRPTEVPYVGTLCLEGLNEARRVYLEPIIGS